MVAVSWSQCRGLGLAEAPPARLDPETNLLWKTAVPPGHSSPVITADRIFLTAIDGEGLWTIALDRASGQELWRRQAPRPRQEQTHKENNAAAASPASDGSNVYVFFGDYGLLAYSADGDELWRLPLGPFHNQMGMSASPILVDGKLILALDDDLHSSMIALDKTNGEMLWRADRAEFTRSFGTPVVYRPAEGPAEILIPGAFQLAGYSAETGEKLWWARGLCWQPKAVAALGEGMAYAHCWAAGGDAPPERTYPGFAEALAELDANHDGAIAKAELYPDLQKNFGGFDLDDDKKLGERDWAYLQAKTSSQNALMAVRLGGRGDVTDTHVAWTHRKSLPNVASPLVYDGVVYLVKDGGIATALDAQTGDVLKMGRLPEAMDKYFASPVAAGGRVYFFDASGVLTVVNAGAQWSVLQTLAFGEGGNATPALLDGRVYIRTQEHVYCFGE
ncbi:MAG: PQQ-binding-like beta-propeller repeat protein [Bryobacterales bacterium]